jgi:predicted DNA-binding ribbon-helix-helix protein
VIEGEEEVGSENLSSFLRKTAANWIAKPS